MTSPSNETSPTDIVLDSKLLQFVRPASVAPIPRVLSESKILAFLTRAQFEQRRYQRAWCAYMRDVHHARRQQESRTEPELDA